MRGGPGGIIIWPNQACVPANGIVLKYRTRLSCVIEPDVETRVVSTMDIVLMSIVFIFTLDTKMVPAERDVVEPVKAFAATMARP